MKTELQKQTKWATHDGVQRWTLALSTPVQPELLSWLAENYQIVKLVTLPSKNLAVLLRADSRGAAALMELPKPRYGGSRHECNEVSWNQ